MLNPFQFKHSGVSVKNNSSVFAFILFIEQHCLLILDFLWVWTQSKTTKICYWLHKVNRKLCLMLPCVFIQASLSPYIPLRFPAASHGLHEYESRVKLKIWWLENLMEICRAKRDGRMYRCSFYELRCNHKIKVLLFSNPTFAVTFCAYSLEIENHDPTPLPQHWDSDQAFDLYNPRHSAP